MECWLAKSISLANKLVDDKKRMESTVERLESLISISLMKMEELRTMKNCIGMKTDVGFQMPVAVPNRFKMPLGKYLTNCTKCNITCHRSCENDGEKYECDVMDHSKPISDRTCLVCPGNCMWDVHASQPFRWKYEQK